MLLAYDAPVLVLRDLECNECRGALHARADASTVVWCAGRPRTSVHGPADQVTVEGPAEEGEEWPVRQAEPWGPVVYPAYDSWGGRSTGVAPGWDCWPRPRKNEGARDGR